MSDIATIDLAPADLDGWQPADLLAALGRAADAFANQRLAVGLLLWKLRTQVPDGVYGKHVVEQARRLEVDERTLRRWRLAAEARFGLDAPDDRSLNRREQIANDRERSGQPVSTPPERVRPSEVIPPEPESRPEKTAAVEQLTLPGAGDWGRRVRSAGDDELLELQRELDVMRRDLAQEIRRRGLAAPTATRPAPRAPLDRRDVTPNFKGAKGRSA